MDVNDKISYIIILRALFVFFMINSGWTVKQCKSNKNTYDMYKRFKK
jgi:hypothetical protein